MTNVFSKVIINQMPNNNISNFLKTLSKKKFENKENLSLSLYLSIYLACVRLFSEFTLLCNNIILSQILACIDQDQQTA